MKSVDKELYAELIAGWIIGVSAVNTHSGNYCTYFEEIDDKFDTNLAYGKDSEMVEMIRCAIEEKSDIVCDVKVYGEMFDVNLFTSFCSLVDDEDDE